MANGRAGREDKTNLGSDPAPERHPIPWTIWVVVSMLGLEGFGNLLAIPSHPVEAYWLAAKCLFIAGLIHGWRPVFVLFLAIAGLHVLAFAPIAPFIAFLNLLDVLLVLSAFRHFFPGDRLEKPSAGRERVPRGVYDRDFDA